jgi:hypothetical protein
VAEVEAGLVKMLSAREAIVVVLLLVLAVDELIEGHGARRE